jgi:plastocyanin
MTRRTSALALLSIGAGALVLGACSSGAGGPATAGSSMPAAHTDAITITNFMYEPMSDEVAPGATITVSNKDSVTHTLSSTDGTFNTGDIAAGHSATFHAPRHPGTYHFICDIHQYMMGTITVS